MIPILQLGLAALAMLFTLQARAQAPTDYVVHEWGTFTSVQGSDGNPMGGMHHEEESLPSFVTGRDVLSERPTGRHDCRRGKGEVICQDFVPGPVVHASSVTQKMETPVVYVHAPKAMRMQVEVGFPGGVISQFYPAATRFTPAIGQLQSLSGGSATFDVQVSDRELPLPEVAPDSVYAPARQVQANFLQSNGQNEKFIFYRGLGNFGTDVRATSAGGALIVTNSSKAPVSAAFVLSVGANGGAFLPLGTLGQTFVSAEQIESLARNRKPMNEFIGQAQSALNQALIASGLYADEAAAMTNTWKNSYFRNPGLRVLYVLSRSETERLLPMRVTPAPRELVRTLVGRIEVLLQSEESALIAKLQADQLTTATLGRFAEPKLRRLRQLTSDRQIQERIDRLIQSLN